MQGDPFDESLPKSGTGQDFGTQVSLFQRMRVPEQREIAWTEFRARYAPIIAGFATRCGAKAQDIDDVVQDVLTGFLGVSERFVYNSELGSFRGYLKTCAIRATIRRAGQNARFRNIPLAEIPQPELAVEPLWADVWEQQLVSEALLTLRQECQDSSTFRAFEQYVLFDRPAEIVAAELKISVNSVHQAKTRITQALRDVVQRLRDSGHW
jgi:RNA polymerase sigma factor (sigma-70 family)